MDVAQAVADPVRRRILVLLRPGPRPVHELVAEFDVSRPAISRHLRVLREAGLVVDEAHGRERRYRLQTAPLLELDRWLHELLAPLPARPDLGALADALATEVVRTRRERRSATAPPPVTDPRPDVRPGARPTEESA
ncbi:ArsR/SmtB family transcription factor [Auraticoccus cholistanensis]|uniref:ArsR/SmtB family transcription factor n=1 Tax=Auraticoccus cholistanensis TaxID=2656650 RepID=UPI002F91AE31